MPYRRVCVLRDFLLGASVVAYKQAFAFSFSRVLFLVQHSKDAEMENQLLMDDSTSITTSYVSICFLCSGFLVNIVIPVLLMLLSRLPAYC